MNSKLFTSRILFYSLRNLGHMEELVHVKQEKEQSQIALFRPPAQVWQRHTPCSSESMTPQARPRRMLTSDSQPAET